MKYIRYLYLVIICLAVAAGVTIVSCSEDKSSDDPDNPETPVINENAEPIHDTLKGRAWVGVQHETYSKITHSCTEYDEEYKVAIVFLSGRDFVKYAPENDYEPVYGIYDFEVNKIIDKDGYKFNGLHLRYNGDDRTSDITSDCVIISDTPPNNYVEIFYGYDDNPLYEHSYCIDTYKGTTPVAADYTVAKWKSEKNNKNNNSKY